MQLPSMPSTGVVIDDIMAGKRVMLDCTHCGASCEIRIGLATNVQQSTAILVWPVHEDAGKGTVAEREAARPRIIRADWPIKPPTPTPAEVGTPPLTTPPPVEGIAPLPPLEPCRPRRPMDNHGWRGAALEQDISFMDMLEQKKWYWVVGEGASARLRRKSMSPGDKAEALTWIVRHARLVAARQSARCSTAPDDVYAETEAIANRPEAWALSHPLCRALLSDLSKLGESWSS
jgi:hypothetical protein